MDLIYDSRYWKSFAEDLSHNPVIDFYEPVGNIYAFLANFYPCKLVVDDKEFSSAEHFYQAQKFLSDTHLYEKVRCALSPEEAKSLSRKHPEKVDPEWELKRIDVMERSVLEKFKQNHQLLRLLLQTDIAILREVIPNEAPTDTFWGWNAKEGGLNMAGKVLMNVRVQLGGYDAFGVCYTKFLTRSEKEYNVAVCKGFQHFVIIIPSKKASELPMVRLHSRCLTGDVFQSVLCDCSSQLWRSLKRIEEHDGGGALLYLDQEGRGLGIVAKIRNCALEQHGIDTVQASNLQGLEPDARDYRDAAKILKRLGIGKIMLMTNNKSKEDCLTDNGIEIVDTIRMSVEEYNINPISRIYFETKVNKLGHHDELISQFDN